MANRYDTAQSFVAPAPVRVRPQVDLPAVAEPVRIEPVFAPTVSPSRDATGATDRARGLVYRMAIPGAMVLLTAIAGVVAYTIVLVLADAGDLVPWMLDRVLIFLAIVAGGGLAMFDRESARDYDHSHAGVERHRIDTAAAIRSEELEAEYRLRQTALSAQLKLLGVGDNDDD